jgi:hypothetical protein
MDQEASILPEDDAISNQQFPDQGPLRNFLKSTFFCQHWSLRVWAISLTCLIVVSVGIFARPMFLYRSEAVAVYQGIQDSYPLCYCGTSVVEAITRGCIYDELAITWLPPDCRDTELTDEFSRSGPEPNGTWPYYADEAGLIPLGLSEVSLYADNTKHFYATYEWHIVHCNYSWRKMFRSITNKVVLEPGRNNLGHISHCLKITALGLPLQSLATKITVNLPGVSHRSNNSAN